jgi:RNA polymerase sigma-70 factor (ECF subfamily)
MFTVDPNIQLAAAGDVTAFEEIYRTYHRRVYSLCFRMIRNAADAEDLTQTVFVQLFRKLKSFRGESTFYTWLHRLTMNEVLMHLRKPAVRREQATDDDSVLAEVEAGNQLPSRTSLIDRISLKEAIWKLSPGYRAVFILHDVAGYEHQQIGRILGCSVGTSKSQLHKARLRLRQLLTKQTSPEQPHRLLNLKLGPDTA